jgi:glycosyltransferase involved in cell wall biosynthesis
MKISVLTPSYNSSQYIERAIKSVMVQDYTNWEHIIVDGDSADGSQDIFRNYPHLIWRSEPDRGQSDAMNKAFLLASGDVIVYLNADDEFQPGVFSKIVAAFSTDAADIVVGNLIVDRMGVKTIHYPSVSLFKALDYKKVLFPPNPLSYFYKRDLQQQIGLFPLHNHYTMDYWFVIRAFFTARAKKIDLVCGTYYFDGRNKSSNSEVSRQYLMAVQQEFIREHATDPKILLFRLRRFVQFKLKRMISRMSHQV